MTGIEIGVLIFLWNLLDNISGLFGSQKLKSPGVYFCTVLSGKVFFILCHHGIKEEGN